MAEWDSLSACCTPRPEIGLCHSRAHSILCKGGIKTPIFTEKRRSGGGIIIPQPQSQTSTWRSWKGAGNPEGASHCAGKGEGVVGGGA